MCVFIENKINKKKIAKVAVGLQVSNGCLLSKAQTHPHNQPFSAIIKAQKNQRAPKTTSFWGPVRDKKKELSGNFAAAASSPFHAATKKTACSRPAVSPVAARPSIAAASLSLARTLSLLPSPAREPPVASALI